MHTRIEPCHAFRPESDATRRGDSGRISRTSVIDTFAIAIVVDGFGTLRAANGTSVALAAGTTWALPAASGELVLEGDTSVVVCQPPAHLPTR